MNTAARIQSLCGQYQEELLISDALMSQLPKSNSLELELVDNLAPKGKQQSIEIYAARLTEATQL
jgi:class 3 adenylate cyclase